MRCNCGINPKYLTDQWLIAEQVELLMIPGMIKKLNYKINNKIPEHFVLGKGHMTFWFNKLIYLNRRHQLVKEEVKNRGFKATDRIIEINTFPKDLCNDWIVTMEDSRILRSRLIWKLDTKVNTKWRYRRKQIDDVNKYKDIINNAELSEV